MSGYFYAFDDAATCGQELPEIWAVDDGADPILIGGAIIRSESGLWLSAPVLSEPDENGDQTVTTQGVKSAPFVILSPVECPGAAAFRITPEGEQGFM
jgi:hypothetical protein